MKKILVSSLFLFSCLTMNAQVVTPKASPMAQEIQMVGLTKVEVKYSRPGKKGRSVFGDLVPYGRLWRTGANENSIITFDDDVIIDDKVLPKGSYAIYTIPSPVQWEIIFYKTINNWGLPQNFDENNVALRTIKNATIKSDFYEYFAIDIEPVDTNNGELILKWENINVAVPFKVPTHEKTMESIALLDDSSKANDYYAAAQYLYGINLDINAQKAYVDKAVSMMDDAPYYVLRLQSLIHARYGNLDSAISIAKKSLEKAEQAKNDDYIKMNRESILEWSK